MTEKKADIFFVSGTQDIEKDMVEAIKSSKAKILEVDRDGTDTYGQELTVFKVSGTWNGDADKIEQYFSNPIYEEKWGGCYTDDAKSFDGKPYKE